MKLTATILAALLPVVSVASFLPYGYTPGQVGPNFEFRPHQPWKPFPTFPSRWKTCVVKNNGNGEDDSQNILEALHECNNGGHVIFSQNKKYTIGTALDLTFLEHIDLDIQGYIQFTDNTTYWMANSFYQVFQNVTTFFQLGGTDVNVYGGGTIDGNGQVWYDLYAANDLIRRPVLFGTIGLHGGSIGDLHFIQTPEYFNFVANSSNVVFYNLNLTAQSYSKNVAKNTDGWDTYRSDNIVIQDSWINNGDDCVSFKPNSTNILVQNLWCNGSHGISVGSLGQYIGQIDIVENVYVYNVSMNNAENGARIKVWPGLPSELSADLQGGGGSGYVKNVVYEQFQINDCDYGVEITQCYGQSNLTLCNEYPSNMTISDVTYKGFNGTTSKKFNPISGYLVCSSPSVCTDIYVSDLHLVSPAGSVNEITCTNIPEQNLIGINCTSINNGAS